MYQSDLRELFHHTVCTDYGSFECGYLIETKKIFGVRRWVSLHRRMMPYVKVMRYKSGAHLGGGKGKYFSQKQPPPRGNKINLEKDREEIQLENNNDRLSTFL